jgi:hypothetical protein
LKILRYTLLGILAILLLAFITVQVNAVQNWLVKITTAKLSKALGTEVSVKNVSISFFNKLNMEGTMVRDKKGDTLLYAGALKVRITDWFFLKEKAELKYVGLEDAVVKLQRRDSVWNYQFVVDYFASPGPKKKNSGGIDLDLKKVDLKNVSFLKNDLWRGERIQANVGNLLVDADKINFDTKNFMINEIVINKPYFYILNLPALRPDSLIHHIDPKADTGLQLNTGDMVLHVRKLEIKNGTASIQADEGKPDPYFDGSHLLFNKINAKFINTVLIKDTLRSDIDINTKERSGIELRRLKAKFRVTPQIMEFAKMDMQTNKSRLGDYYAMKYKAFNANFGDYINKVVMEARFKDAKVSSDDIAYFAPELQTWKKEVLLSGNFYGTVADFNVKNLFAKAGNTTYMSGTLAMKGLPNIEKTQINFNNGTLKTNYNDAAIFVPAIKEVQTPDLASLGDILFRGTFNGTIYDFKTAGNISTAIGAITADVSMQIPKKADASYSGTVNTIQFNIGKFLKYDLLGLVDFNGKISGNNFAIDKLKTTIQGNISSIEFNDYKYVNITTNGTFQKKYFNGEVKIDDPNIDFKSQVEVDLSKDQPSFNILGDLVKSNLKPLNFFRNNLELTGLLDVNFTGKDIDHFEGSAKFLNANIKSDDVRLGFDSLNLSSSFKDSAKSLKLTNNEFTATIDGEFKIADLPNNFQAFLHRYYPAYINAPAASISKQQFIVTVTTNFIEPYLKLYDKKISGFNDLRAEGIVNTKKDSFAIAVKVPFARYGNYSLTGADINGVGNLDSLSLNGIVSSVQVSDSLSFPNSRFSVKASNDHSIVSLKTSASNTLNEADLNADVFTLKDGVRIKFDPSSFILNEKKWHLEKEGELVLRKDFVSAQNVKFSQGFQEITVEPDTEKSDTKNNLILKLKNVVLGDVTSLFFKDPKLEGSASGEVHFHDFYGKFKIDADLKAEQFRIEDDSIGLVNIKGGYNSTNGIIPFSVQSLNKGHHFSAEGFYDLKDSANSPLNINAKLDSTRISYLNKLLVGIFSEVDGIAVGNLKVNGKPNTPEFSGNVKLYNANLKVDYTQVSYKIDSAEIKFEEDGIDFGELRVHDAFKNIGIVKGKLYEKGFKNMIFDFDLATNKLLLIDTKQKDNPQFYGKAIGKAKLSFKGPEENCKMSIVAEANDSSLISIMNTVSKEGDDNFIVFKKYGTEIEASEKESNFNLLVDLDLTANKKVEIDVILDPLSGDVIKATGDGRLRIKVGSNDPLNIRGKYAIDNGKYDFSFQSFIRKPFILKPESGNYIEWTGDPMNADIHIDAQYIADNVSVSDLISGQNLSLNSASKVYRGPVYVIASLTDKLSKPTINFKLDFPQSSPIKTDALFTEFINKIEKDDNEMLKQVTYLIVFNMFAPYGQANGAGNLNVASLGVNTLSQLLTNQLNKTVSNVLDKVFHDKSLHFDLGTSVYSSNSLLTQTSGGGANANNNFDRSRINFKIGYSFFNDKVLVSFGGEFDFNVGNNAAAAQSGNFQWLPDLNVEYYITKDKKLRAVIFSKNSLNYNGGSLGNQNRKGIGLSYKRDFERIFAKKDEEIQFAHPTDTVPKPKTN